MKNIEVLKKNIINEIIEIENKKYKEECEEINKKINEEKNGNERGKLRF